MNSIWIASLDTRRNSFEAFGATHDEARDALLRGLTEHAKQCGFASNWSALLIDGANVRGVKFGAAYRDRELI